MNLHKSNNLINEKSPYLLQHAYNPVNWYPWGEEAFSKAKEEDKPIFLSIGYSTCHWCHVMAHESFEDEEVANLLNSKFVSIKVDREERPDIDSIYMKVCQMLTGQGGWPLSVFLTPDQKPFYSGTYYPKKSSHGRPGFVDLINELADIYTRHSDKISTVTDQIFLHLTDVNDINKDSKLSNDILYETFSQIENSFDKIYGGLGNAPKFPTPHILTFLLKYYFFNKNYSSLFMVKKTLEKMANGGINDHIGFGFSRYSVDEKWLVPHFEKMLYDNALLLLAYAETYQLTKEPRYKELCEQIIIYIETEMTDSKGGFYSALDADSEGIEGKYYVWCRKEIYDVLGDDLGELYCKTYDITENGNFDGKNIPNLINTDKKKIALSYNITIEQLNTKLEQARQKLLLGRKERIPPHVDDKILTSWNSLMIVALAKTSRITEKNKCLKLAKNSLTFIENNLTINNRVMVRYRDGEVKNNGYIDDYAFLLWAYLELYESTYDLVYLKKAKQLTDNMIALFWDKDNGGFYFYGKDAEDLIIREKQIYDGAIPSGNGVASLVMTRLANLIGDFSLLENVDDMFFTFKNKIESYPAGHTSILQSLIQKNLSKKEVVILGKHSNQEFQKLISTIQESYSPNLSILVAESSEEFRDIADFAIDYQMIDDQVTAYICENFTCKQPITDINKIYEELGI
ncbi:MAG: thioredoxin domain-containing protein [Vulcanibacillus sp.]